MKKISTTNYFILTLLCLLFVLYVIIQFVNADKEGFDVQEVEDKIKSTFKDINFTLIDPVNISLQKVRDFFNKVVRGFKKDVVEPTEKFIQDARDKLNLVKTRMNTIKKGMDTIFSGIGDEFVALGDGLKTGFDDIGLLLIFLWEYVKTFADCGKHYIVNFKKCFPFYIIDKIVSSIINFIIYLLNIPGVLYGQANNKPALYTIPTKSSYIPWSETILNDCYICPRLKTDALKLKAKQVDDDFKIKLPRRFDKATEEIKDGGRVFLSAFSNNPLA